MAHETRKKHEKKKANWYGSLVFDSFLYFVCLEYFVGNILMFLFDLAEPAQTQNLPLSDLWQFLPVGYLFTIIIETSVLLVGLSPKVSLKQKLWCGVWLTACTYPIVILVLPAIFFGESRALYLSVAETFAPVAECFLFWVAFRGKDILIGGDWFRCFVAIVLANLASFGIGEIMNQFGWFGLF